MAADRSTWINAAVTALRRGGIDAVRVETLAEELRVTKGSFYWHFRDRADLLRALLESWEAETDWLVGEAHREAQPGDRLLAFFALAAATRVYPPDTAIFAWARRDSAVARRVAATEEKRIAFIETQLSDSGIAKREARRRAEIGYLATLGWLERSARAAQTTDFGALTKFLFTFLLDDEHHARNTARNRSPLLHQQRGTRARRPRRR